MDSDHDVSGLAIEAELFFIQIGLGDSRERDRLLALGNENLSCATQDAEQPAAALVRTTNSSGDAQGNF
jgi:hypothetical protein